MSVELEWLRYCVEQIESMLKGYSYINIIGIANTDEEEIKLIEESKPDVVVTDLMRNHEFTGLDIIKDYTILCLLFFICAFLEFLCYNANVYIKSRRI